MGLTKKVLKRPVTTVLVVLCLIVFGLSSIFSSQLELIPEMEMPMLIISAVYPGASPDDVDQLVISKIEDEIGTLSGVDSVTSMSSENFGMVLVQYDYDQDMGSSRISRMMSIPRRSSRWISTVRRPSPSRSTMTAWITSITM